MINLSVNTGNKAIDDYFKGNISLINNLLMSMAEEQIKQAFIQSENEVNDLHTMISQGMRESKNARRKIGLTKGTKLITEKFIQCKGIILKHSKDFNGSLEDYDVIKLCGCKKIHSINIRKN